MRSEPEVAETAYVALGSNLGDREDVFIRVLRAIEAEPGIELLAASPIIETDPVGPGRQNDYLNAVVRIRTRLSAPMLLAFLQRTEIALGRDRGDSVVRWGPRVIDLDLLFHGDAKIDCDGLEVPHPRAAERAFVLVPMVQLAPDFEHPVLRRTMRELLDELPEIDSARSVASPDGWPG